jgi:hypothetical protein
VELDDDGLADFGGLLVQLGGIISVWVEHAPMPRG